MTPTPKIWPHDVDMNFQSDMEILMTKRKKSVWIWPGIEWDKGEPDITCMGADSVSHRRGVWMNGYILVFERYSDKLPPICHVKV